MARHEAMNAKAKSGGIDLVYIVDSIVEFFETQGLDIFQRWEKTHAGAGCFGQGQRNHFQAR